MTDKYGPRVEIGQLIGRMHSKVVTYICPYGIMMQHKFYCPYRDSGLTSWTTMLPEPIAAKCPMHDKKHNGISGVRYCVQELMDYIRADAQNKMEVKMNVNKIVEARQFGEGNFVAEGQLVDVVCGYLGDELYKRIGGGKFKARVVSFDSDDRIELDLSKPFEAKVIYLEYSKIDSITACEDQKC